MNIWKLGCRWGSKKDNKPLYFDFLKGGNIVISWGTDKDFGINATVLLTDGYKVLGLAVTTSEKKSIDKIEGLKASLDNFQVNTGDPLCYYNAIIYDVAEYNIIYENQTGITRVKHEGVIKQVKEIMSLQKKTEEHDKIQQLLECKKQIILQGPPGTGKTRLAKEIVGNNLFKSLSDDKKLLAAFTYYIFHEVSHLAYSTREMYCRSVKEELDFRLKEDFGFGLNDFSMEPDFFSMINQIITLNQVNSRTFTGLTHFETFLDKYTDSLLTETFSFNLLDNLDVLSDGIKEDIAHLHKIVQFHPSYTYEDFVRGITVKNNENGQIKYQTENRVLATIAQAAKQNWDEYYQIDNRQSKEQQVGEWFEDFVDTIQLKIEECEGLFMLTDNIGINSIEEDAFRYKGLGSNWTPKGLKMYFKDIIKAFLDGNVERQDLKKNIHLSGLAKQHASYYVRVLNLFQDYINENKLEFNNNKRKEPLKDYFLIIDEINRANLSSVLGELIYALEYRGNSVESMYAIDGSREIILPPNLYIIGTMNTADRSVGQIDYAIRRRFAFVDVLPKEITNTELEMDGKRFAKESFESVAELFIKNTDYTVPSEYISEEFKPKDVWLGHSYFIYDKDGDFKTNLEYEIKPILREYVADGILKDSALEIIEKLQVFHD